VIYVALLRGVNVGGKGRVEMARLKELVESLGASDVTTYINSGNVIFEDRRSASKLVALLEQAIVDEFAVESRVVVRDDASSTRCATPSRPAGRTTPSRRRTSSSCVRRWIRPTCSSR
jgi:uncharacterized protein (DUF1697 family)